MNSAIFLYTFRRFFDWQQVVLGIGIMATIALLVGTAWATGHGVVAETCRWLLFGPTMPFVVSSIIVLPQIANAQQRKDGEYLSLLFTRPVSRSTYVITKWLTAALFTFLVIIVQALACSALASMMEHAMKLPPNPHALLDQYSIIDVAGNSLTFAAVAVLLASCPRRLRTWFALSAMILALSLTSAVGLSMLMNGCSLAEASDTIRVAFKFIAGFFMVSVDSYHLINSAESPVCTLIIHVSNIVVFLTLASFILCTREFFYAND